MRAAQRYRDQVHPFPTKRRATDIETDGRPESDTDSCVECWDQRSRKAPTEQGRSFLSIARDRDTSSYLRLPNAWIEQRKNEIDNEVHRDKHRAGQKDASLNDRGIAALHRIDRFTSQARKRKELLDDKRAGKQKSKARSDRRDDRQDRI